MAVQQEPGLCRCSINGIYLYSYLRLRNVMIQHLDNHPSIYQAEAFFPYLATPSQLFTTTLHPQSRRRTPPASDLKAF